jgi:hypothetical protein
MKKALEKAIAALVGGSKKMPLKYNVETLDAPASVVTPARIDGTYAEDLAGKIGLAFLRYGNAPNSSAVAGELQKIADLSRNLHRALNHTTSPVAAHITNAYGGLGNFRLLRRDILAKLDTLHRATNLTKAKRGAKPDLYAKAVADAAAATYQEVSGRKPTRVTNPDTNVPGGPFYVFLSAVFAAARVDADPRTHVTRLTARQKGSRSV